MSVVTQEKAARVFALAQVDHRRFSAWECRVVLCDIG